MPGWHKLIIYDALGDEIMVVADAYKPAGNYEIEIDLAGFSSGVYFYKLIVNNHYSNMMKMVYLK